MRRAVTFSLVVLTAFSVGCQPLAAFSTRHRDGSRLRRHSGRTGTAALIGFAVSGRIFNPNDNVRRVFCRPRRHAPFDD